MAYDEAVARLLADIGYLGQVEIDFAASRVRADPGIGRVLGIDPARIADGVTLAECDAAIIPEDLEMIRKHRRDTAMTPGRYQLNFSIHDRDRDGSVPIQSIMTVKADRFGIATRASGILLADPVQRPAPANDQLDAESLLRLMQVAIRGARQLGFDSAARLLPTVYTLTAEDARERAGPIRPATKRTDE